MGPLDAINVRLCHHVFCSPTTPMLAPKNQSSQAGFMPTCIHRSQLCSRTTRCPLRASHHAKRYATSAKCLLRASQHAERYATSAKCPLRASQHAERYATSVRLPRGGHPQLSHRTRVVRLVQPTETYRPFTTEQTASRGAGLQVPRHRNHRQLESRSGRPSGFSACRSARVAGPRDPGTARFRQRDTAVLLSGWTPLERCEVAVPFSALRGPGYSNPICRKWARGHLDSSTVSEHCASVRQGW